MARGGDGWTGPAGDLPAEQPRSLQLRYFDEILPIEHTAINARRAAISERARGKARGEIEPNEPVKSTARDAPAQPSDAGQPPTNDGDVRLGGKDPPDPKRSRPRPVPCTSTGLALSGGGIRSAAFCLGALQGLNNHGAIESIDYLSTVSGGGYIGSCLSASMSVNKGAFPFGQKDAVQDTPAVGHLRNYSNYLLPRAHSGLRNLSEATVIILRGLIANAAVVLAFLLAFALLTRVAYPDRADLLSGSFALRLLDVPLFRWWTDQGLNHWIGPHAFGFTLVLLGALAVLLFFWARHKSLTEVQAGDTRGTLLFAARGLFIAVVVIAFLDLQPVLIEGLAQLYQLRLANTSAATVFNSILAFLTAASGLVSLLASRFGRFLETSQHSTKLRTLIARVMTRAALFVAAMTLPILLLAAYVYLSAWSINGMDAIPNPLSKGVDWWMILLFWSAVVLLLLLSYRSTAAPKAYLYTCTLILVLMIGYLLVWYVNPKSYALRNPFAPVTVIWVIYLAGFLALLVLCVAFKPNAYSLHQFYRDRLSKAFLFDPCPKPNGDLRNLNGLKLSDIAPSYGPYHIVNAALNIQGSTEANKRGRDADFFIFTRDFVGSDLTLFGATQDPTVAVTVDMERVDPNLNLGCAMAVSGAALSSNMGAKTVRLLSPTLALLNIRLGYWMRNPRDVARAGRKMRGLYQWLQQYSGGSGLRGRTVGLVARAAGTRVSTSAWNPIRWFNRVLVKFYLIPEMFNLIDESSRNILLTDGGHIENLGVYELLKRGCQLIIAIDAEADPALSFSSLMKLQRHARIDLGVRIELPWEDIARMAHSASAELAKDPGTGAAPAQLKAPVGTGDPKKDEPNAAQPSSRRCGPHCAIGRIFYDTGAEGVLLYIKSSLTGDEKDYVLDYKKRNPLFPHESTGDQFFSEEQFEVYRALGFHTVEGFFNGDHVFTWSDSGRRPWKSAQAARSAVERLIPTLVPRPRAAPKERKAAAEAEMASALEG